MVDRLPINESRNIQSSTTRSIFNFLSQIMDVQDKTSKTLAKNYSETSDLERSLLFLKTLRDDEGN
ncbi:MAG: hypothetical protein ACFFD4_32970 [Candidatus Odinarchaeota archaeon]